MSPLLPMCGLLVMSLPVCEIVLQRNRNKTYLSGRAGSASASWSGLNVMFTYKHPNPQPYGRKYATKEKSRRTSRDSHTKGSCLDVMDSYLKILFSVYQMISKLKRK